MAKKNYSDIARKKLENNEPPGKKKVVYYDEKSKQNANSGGVSLGYVIFVACVIIGGVAIGIMVAPEEEPETIAPLRNDGGSGTTQTVQNAPETGIQDGDEVEIAYKLWVDWDQDGYFDPNEEPYQDSSFTTEISPQGLIFGFYKNVLGMEEGQEKTFIVPPEEAYDQGDLAGLNLKFYVRIIDIK